MRCCHHGSAGQAQKHQQRAVEPQQAVIGQLANAATKAARRAAWGPTPGAASASMAALATVTYHLGRDLWCRQSIGSASALQPAAEDWTTAEQSRSRAERR
jgi:hypothetical protein